MPTAAQLALSLSLDGLQLSGTLVTPAAVRGTAMVVHGGGVTREEDGFFTRLAYGLANAGLLCLRFDLAFVAAVRRRQPLSDDTVCSTTRRCRPGRSESQGLGKVD
ncbi:alpha/beta hydrolase family protein [Actinomadura formosensis]|uniref:alpha/beta hydrolase family protein n=1 Tax=Actinomadura formosensis TaxID=60706 RepID=UPI00083222EF|nr:hypothetical protein [Actinomadura formosensis]